MAEGSSPSSGVVNYFFIFTHFNVERKIKVSRKKTEDLLNTLVSFIINIVFSTAIMEALRAKDTKYIFQLSGYNL